MKLSDVVDSKPADALRIVIHGSGGVGKTRFASGAPKPIFLCTEEGVGSVRVKRFPGRPESLEDAISAVNELIVGKHDYKTLVIDSIDRLSEVICADVCREKGVESMSDVDYGKLYDKLIPRHKKLIAKLDELREKRNMHVIAICHSQSRTVINPEGPDYDKVDLKLPETKTVKVSDLWKEEADVVGYASLETSVQDKNGKGKAKTNGVRALRCGPSIAFAAKNRFDLPSLLPLNWDDFYTAVLEGVGVPPEDALAEIADLRGNLSGDDQEKLDSYLPTVQDDPKKLFELLNRLRVKVIS